MIRKFLNSEPVRAAYGAALAVVIALSATGVVEQSVVEVVVEVGVILGLGEVARSRVTPV